MAAMAAPPPPPASSQILALLIPAVLAPADGFCDVVGEVAGGAEHSLPVLKVMALPTSSAVFCIPSPISMEPSRAAICRRPLLWLISYFAASEVADTVRLLTVADMRFTTVVMETSPHPISTLLDS